MNDPIEHLDRVSRGEFPEATRHWLQDTLNGCIRGHMDIVVSPLGKYQRDSAIRELWGICPENTDSGRAKAILSGYRRFGGRVVAGRPASRLYGRLKALSQAGYKMPESERQIVRICTEDT